MQNILKKEGVILEVISSIYIFVLLLIFPIMVDSTGFFKILEFKWHAYLVIGTLYIFSIIGVYLYFLLFKKANYLKKIKLKKCHYFLFAFMIINLIACFFSPFYSKHNLLVGVGRGEGLIMMMLYSVSFLFVSLFAKFNKKHILYFSISSILISTIAVLQYIGLNPFNMFQDGIGTHNVSFTTTIGNIDFISAIYCILLTVSFSAFVFLENDKRSNKIIHFISILLGFFIFEIINVSSGKVAFIGTFILILPFILTHNKRFARALFMLATILFGYCFNIILNPQYHYDIGKLTIDWQFNWFALVFLILIAIMCYLSYILYTKQDFDYSKNKKVIKIIYFVIIGCGICGVIGLYAIDFGRGILHEIHELLHGNFDDDFGTYRIFLWKRTIPLIKEYPIFGTGADSFALRFMPKYTNDIVSIGELSLNDTAANVYLTMAINIVITGLISYLGFVFCQLKDGIKRMNNYSRVLLIAFVCYLIQDFFNLWLVIITPIFWLLMALHISSLDYKEKENG